MAENALLETASETRGLLPKFREIAGVLLLLAATNFVTYLYVLEPADPPRFVGVFDQWLFIGPNQFFLDTCIHNGEFPLWNPLVWCGTPFAADPQMQVFYPLNLVRSLLTFHPTPFRTHVGLLILAFVHILLAGSGAYCLARYHRLSKSAGLVAAFVLIFGTKYVHTVVYNQLWIGAIAWTPWLFLTTFGALDARTRREFLRRALIAGLVLTVTILGGHPQFVVYIMGAFTITTLVYAIRKRSPEQTDRTILNKNSLTQWFQVLTITTAIGILGSFVLILPAQEFISLSTRAKDSGILPDGIDFFDWPSPLYLIELIISFPIGVGIAATLLVLTALLGKFTRVTILYIAVLHVFLDFAAGKPLPCSVALSLLLPGDPGPGFLGLQLLPFPLALLAAQGVDSVRTPIDSRRWRFLKALIVAASGVFLISLRLSPTTMWLTPKWMETEPGISTILVPMLFVVIFCMGFWQTSRKTSVQPLFPILIFIELLVLNWIYLPKAFREYPNPYTLSELYRTASFVHKNERTNSPAMHDVYANQGMYTLTSSIGGYNGLHLAQVYKTISSVDTERSYHRMVGAESALTNQRWNVFLKRQFWLAPCYVKGNLPAKTELFPSTAVAFLPEDKPKDVQEISPASVKDMAILSETPVYTVSNEVLEKAIENGNNVQGEGARISVTSNSVNSVSANVAGLEKHELLIFTQAYHPGWRAYVDDIPSDILRANNVFMAVELPPGNHRASFIFQSHRVYGGLAVSIITLVVAAIGCSCYRWPVVSCGTQYPRPKRSSRSRRS